MMTRISSLGRFAEAVSNDEWIEINKPHLGTEDLWNPIDIRTITVDSLVDQIARGNIRIKPALKKIDLSGLVGSGVLCEFWDHKKRDQKYIGRLLDTGLSFGCNECDTSFERCRPLFNHPHAYEGGEMAIPYGFKGIIARHIGLSYKSKTVDCIRTYYEERGVIAWPVVEIITITGYAEGYEHYGKG